MLITGLHNGKTGIVIISVLIILDIFIFRDIYELLGLYRTVD